MIYFIQNKTTGPIKIGYSSNPKKRLITLQTATPDELVLLGTVQGGIEHEAAFHAQFAKYALQGEWFKKDILADVMAILARAAANPQPQKTNVIVFGDSDADFMLSSDQRKMEEKARLQLAVHQALDEIHAKTPVAWVVTGGDRQHDHFAWQWAAREKVQIQRFYPNWRRYRSGAGSKVGLQMLRSQFDPKLALILLASKVSSSTQGFMRQAEKAGIEIVKRTYAYGSSG